MIFLTSPGKTYSVNSVGGCTISAGGTTLATIPANVQTTFIAPDEEVLVSDNNAIIVEVTGVGAGGSGGSGEGGVTAEEIQAVAPIAWEINAVQATVTGGNNIAAGSQAHAQYNGTSVGARSYSDYCSVAIGTAANARNTAIAIGYDAAAVNNMESGGIAIGSGARTGNINALAIGGASASKAQNTIAFGGKFTETTDSGNVTHTCITEGTGSITIGAGANTLNTTTTVDGVETTVESSNSVTIGCKAENKGADSVVIGAQAVNKYFGNVIVGAGADTELSFNSVSIGTKAKAWGYAGGVAVGKSSNAYSTAVAIGQDAKGEKNAIAIGAYTQAKPHGIAIGAHAKAADEGVVVFRSITESGEYSTQLYFSGANTSLANTYANGEAIMGYVTSDKDGNPIASGFKRLSALFDEGTMTQPATLDENGEWVQPKVFRPSDIDLPVEEPTEPEPYTPLPVYPIVEPEIEEIPSES